MDAEIETERFIKEVRARPVLWDTSIVEYRDRSKTKEAWASIVLTMGPHLENGEKRELGKELQLKWRNLRDAFMRAERNSNTQTSRGVTKQKKKYRYAQQMEFLKKSILPRAELLGKRKGSMEMVNDDDETDSSMLIQIKNENNSNSIDGPSIDYNLEEIMEFTNAHSQEIAVQHLDDDMCFFQSLLPTVRMLSSYQKFTFRINVMGLLQKQMSDNARQSN